MTTFSLLGRTRDWDSFASVNLCPFCRVLLQWLLSNVFFLCGIYWSLHTSKTFSFILQKPLWNNIKPVYGLPALILAVQLAKKNCLQVDNKWVFCNEMQMVPHYKEKETEDHIKCVEGFMGIQVSKILML